MPLEITELTNPDASEYVSELLSLVVSGAGTQPGPPPKVRRDSLPGRKATIIVEVLVGLSVAATWDLIKFAIQRLAHARKPDAADRLSINGHIYTLTEVESAEPPTADAENGEPKPS